MRPAAPTIRASRRQRGAATVEFYIVAFLAFIPLLLAIMQMGLFMVAKNTVNTAALNAARAGGASGASKSAMLDAFATGVMPLHASTGLRVLGGSGVKEVTRANYAAVAGAALLRAKAEMALPYNYIRVLNPNAASFRDFGVTRSGVGRLIPVTNMDIDRRVVGGGSRQTRADALLLKIEAHYCYDMVMPVIDDLIAEVLQWWPTTSAETRACLLRKPVTGNRGIPIVAQAVVRMTVPPVQERMR